MVGARDTPPDIQSGPFGYEPDISDGFEMGDDGPSQKILDEAVAKKLGTEIWSASTNWINSGRRARWNDSLRAFQSQHPSGSKYLSGDYRFRSTLYRPKTRAMVRRDEAATASAFFSNEDVVSIEAQDDDDPKQQASAEILKALLQYRLTNTIPWFLTLVGARQDAEVMGICVAKADWEYEERFLKTELRPKMGENGMPVWDTEKKRVATESFDLYEKVKDQPYVDLLAPENFRFEPGCDWRNPVKSSPYLIELQPFYIQDAMLSMESQHGAPPAWKRVAISALRGATDRDDDVTRRARETGRVPGQDHDTWKPKDYDICWTRLNIVRWAGMDWSFRTLGSGGEILEPPRPIREVYLHGERPYVVGCCVLETHKTYPSSKVELTVDLQRAANQDWNTRFDNIMLSLQPRQFVREGSGQDINDLTEFMPGRTVMVNAGKGEPLSNTITWDRPPPVDGSSFQEQDRINLDWDDLTGAFSNSSVQGSQQIQQSATGMHLMSGEASGLNEYELRLFSETFVEPLMKLLIKLEQAYETDPIILALAGKRAQLFQKFNVSEITDELLNQSVTVRVNVGIGATNPQLKLRNFATAGQMMGQLFGPALSQGANFEEISKELFGLLGYKDGSRFFKPGFDPQQAMQQMQQGKGGNGAADQARLQIAQLQAQSKADETKAKIANEQYLAQLDFKDNQLQEQQATEREWLKYQAGAAMTGLDHAHRTHLAGQQQMALSQAPQSSPPGQPTPSPASSATSAGPSSIPAMPMAPAGGATSQSPHPAMPGQPGPQIPSNGSAELQSVLATFSQTMGEFASVILHGNQQLAQQNAQSLAALIHESQLGNQQIIMALTRPKRVVRGPDGRVEGVE